MKKNSILIIGAGITGLMLAWFFKKKFPKKNISIIDSSNMVGGKYTSFDYGKNKIFDFGMHIFYETCDKKIDSIYTEILDKNEWNIYSDNEKDIAGVFFNGKLQDYSQYPDLRELDKKNNNKYTNDYLKNLENFKINDISAKHYLESRFGNLIYKNIHKPLLKMMYGIEPEKLSKLTIKLSALDRIILFNKELIEKLMKIRIIKNTVAYPDQLNLPIKRLKNQRALYPKKFGLLNFMKIFEKKLSNEGVNILKETRLQKINFTKNKIESCDILINNKLKNIGTSHLISTIGWQTLLKPLGLNFKHGYDKSRDLIIANIGFNNKLNMDRLYYFYCYDKKYSIFRVTNYENYCPNASKKNYHPVSIELWPSKNNLKMNGSDDYYKKIILKELKDFKVIDKNHDINFFRVHMFSNVLPTPTLNNLKINEMIMNKIKRLKIQNLYVSGILANKDLFFSWDILKHAFKITKDIK